MNTGTVRASKAAWPPVLLFSRMTVDRDTPMLLPPSLRDWVPEDHLVHFVIDAVEQLDLRSARVNERGSGSEQYPPATMLAPFLQRLVHRTATAAGRARYKQRQQTVEPVFGIVKAVLGFRRFQPKSTEKRASRDRSPENVPLMPGRPKQA